MLCLRLRRTPMLGMPGPVTVHGTLCAHAVMGS